MKAENILEILNRLSDDVRYTKIKYDIVHLIMK